MVNTAGKAQAWGGRFLWVGGTEFDWSWDWWHRWWKPGRCRLAWGDFMSFWSLWPNTVRILAWLVGPSYKMPLRFPKLEQETEVSAVLRATLMGKASPSLPCTETGPHGTGLFCRCPYRRFHNFMIWSRWPLWKVSANRILRILQMRTFGRPWASWHAINACAGYGRASLQRKPSAAQLTALQAVRQCVRRALPGGPNLARKLKKNCLCATWPIPEKRSQRCRSLGSSKSFRPYTGIAWWFDAGDLVCEGTRRWFLDHPEESLLDVPVDGVRLQAKVHVENDEALALCQLLVQRNICSWIPDDEVLTVQGQKVLSGMFAVGKGTFLEGGDEVQRLIMNLIPNDACFKHSQGGTADLPSITQYFGLVLDRSDRLVYFQSDMTSAFYLFKIPVCCSKMMAFSNNCFQGGRFCITTWCGAVLYLSCNR